MLYYSSTRPETIRTLKEMQACLMPDETELWLMTESLISKLVCMTMRIITGWSCFPKPVRQEVSMQTRDKWVHFVMTGDEYERIRQKMEKIGIRNQSSYLRKMAMGGLLREP
jgi:hypothetical protein